MNHVISLSGGKDSTAMLHMMLERGERIHSAVFFDTGWEFPQMYDHIAEVEQKTGLRVWRLRPRFPYEYWLMARPVVARKGENKGKVARIGNGWPSPSRRWCTREKADTLNRYCKPISNAVQCIGYATDEPQRSVSDLKVPVRFPLREWNITEEQALEYCYRLGYTWAGLYKHFRRVSCFCCPLQRIGELRKLRRHFPELWQRMLEWDSAIPNNRGFRGYQTVHDLDRRFAKEEEQLQLWSTEQPDQSCVLEPT